MEYGGLKHLSEKMSGLWSTTLCSQKLYKKSC